MIKTVESTLDILDFLLVNGSVSFSTLQQGIEIPKSSLHSIIESLLRHDYVVFDDDKKQYHLSLKFLCFGEKVKSFQKPLVEIAQPILQQLTDEVHETSFLGITANYKQVIIGVCESDNALRSTAKVGEHSLMHYTGIGKVLLSGMSHEDIDKYINLHGLEKKTENTIASKEKLLEELQKISQTGYAIDNLEHNKYIRCIGSGIRNREGNIIAAVSISGPKDRVSLERMEELAKKVINAADKISERIKGLPSESISFI